MSIRALLSTKTGSIVDAHPDITVADAVRLLVENRIGAVPIIENAEILGIFSERDVMRGLAHTGAQMLDRPVRDIMTAPAIAVQPDISVLAALSLMTQRRIRHLPVVDAGVLVGFVSIGDLVKYRIDNIEQEAAAMRDYIQSA